MAKNMDAYWMPFTANRQFKKAPRLLAKSSGMNFWTPEGREILDGVAGLWCVNAGHTRPKIVKAIAEQAAHLRFDGGLSMVHQQQQTTQGGVFTHVNLEQKNGID